MLLFFSNVEQSWKAENILVAAGSFALNTTQKVIFPQKYIMIHRDEKLHKAGHNLELESFSNYKDFQ